MNYQNLSDFEFEALCNDVMSRKLNISLRRFAAGRDGGVDLTDDTVNKNIVVQVKHYHNSSIPTLVRALKNELPKVKSLHPKQYYICCSRELSQEKIKELRLHFGSYMKNDDNIITCLELDEFLSQEENKDILKRHFKLWIESVQILEDALRNDIFVDCSVLVDEINRDFRMFVRTDFFDKALAQLGKDRVLCLIGNPGVGKSITSKMLVLNYAALGYTARYTTDVTDLTTLKRSLSSNNKLKEVILLDDCFGQAYFEMQAHQCTELTGLIKYVKAHKSKILILNSRVTIFKEARKKSLTFSDLEDEGQFNTLVLNLNNMSNVDKAKILYNHLTVRGMPSEYLEAIKRDRLYRTIINHLSFNPRIIEFVCRERRYKDVKPEDFPSFVIQNLNNPAKIWNDEYEQNLRTEDRILLQTIYSISTTSANLELVQECFNKRISKCPLVDKTIAPFKQALDRLMDGFVVVGIYEGVPQISMINPSLNDFFDHRLASNADEKQDIITNISSVHQLRLIPKHEQPQYIKNILSGNNLDSFFFENEIERQTFILGAVLNYKICDLRFEKLMHAFLLEPKSTVRMSSIMIPNNWESIICDPILFQFYNLERFLCQDKHITLLLENEVFEYGIDLICSLSRLIQVASKQTFIHQSQRWINNNLKELCDVDMDDYSSDVDIDSALMWAKNDEEIDTDEFADALEDAVKEFITEKCEKLTSRLPLEISSGITCVTEDDITVNFVDQFVDDYLEELQNDSSDYFCNSSSKLLTQDNFDAVDAIFES